MYFDMSCVRLVVLTMFIFISFWKLYYDVAAFDLILLIVT